MLALFICLKTKTSYIIMITIRSIKLIAIRKFWEFSTVKIVAYNFIVFHLLKYVKMSKYFIVGIPFASKMQKIQTVQAA